MREQLDHVRTERDESRNHTSELHGQLATMTAERDAARADVERERAHGDQRVEPARQP